MTVDERHPLTPSATLAAPVLAICGWSGAGKTTLLEAVIAELARRGLRVGVVKHDAHGVALDAPGKDSERLFRAGADVLLRAPEQAFARWHDGSAPDLTSALGLLAAEHDIVLVEGHKDTPLPKVWLASRDDPSQPDQVTNVLAALPWNGQRERAVLEIVAGLLSESLAARPVFGGMLVGGSSSRMGRPKQLLSLAGANFLARVADALAPHVERLVLLGAGEVPQRCAGLPRLPDPPGLLGPLAGLLAALRWAPAACWVAAACDMPLLSADAVAWLLAQRKPGAWVVMPEGPAGAEPLFAVYEPQARTLLERMAARGRLAPSRLAGEPGVRMARLPAALLSCVRNVNTPEDLAALT